MASLRNVVGDDRQRLVYGIDLMRGIARVDQGTGGGSPLAADNAPVFDAYAQTAAYMQSQWFGETGEQIYAGLRGGTRRRLGRRVLALDRRHRSALAGPLQLQLNAATAFRAPTAEELYYPGFSNPNLAPERTRVGDATLVDACALGRRQPRLVYDERFEPDRFASAVLHSGKRRSRVDPGLSLSRSTPPLHGCVATSGVTNLYRAQDLDTDTRLPGRGPVFAVRPGCVTSRRQRAASTDLQSSRERKARKRAPDPFLSPAYAVYQPATFTQVDAYVGYRLSPRLVVAIARLQPRQRSLRALRGISDAGTFVRLEMRSR